MDSVKLTTFNLENLGIRPGEDSPEARRRLPAHLETLGRVVANLNSDVLCVQEVIDPDNLAKIVEGLNFPYCEISRPPKNPLCMAVLSRYPILSAANVVETAHIEARDIDADFSASVEAHFSRPVFEARIAVGERQLTIYNVHWKSKIPTALSSGAGQTWPWANFFEVAQGRLISEVTRMAQAMGLRKLIDGKLGADPGALVAVVGDFNDLLDSEAVRMIIGDSRAVRASELAPLELWPCEAELPPDKNYTMVYRGSRQMLDHVFVSRGLKERFVRAEVLHDGMKVARENSWSDMRPGSDHAPFSVYFDLKSSGK